MKNQPMQHHYFITGFDVYVCDEDLNLGLKRFWNCSKSDQCSIYRVPLPETAVYSIEFYVPKVNGTVWIDTVFKTKTARLKGDTAQIQKFHNVIAERNQA